MLKDLIKDYIQKTVNYRLITELNRSIISQNTIDKCLTESLYSIENLIVYCNLNKLNIQSFSKLMNDEIESLVKNQKTEVNIEHLKKQLAIILLQKD